jgi:RNA polymerase sigma factor (sigma-70 family)
MHDMMTLKAMSFGQTNDAELVGATMAGNRDAFGLIVARYQSLICSLAYSATGSFGQSEDLAQETFITAWKHLSHLRERDKLRAWLCGIARNRINSFLRREGREPVRDAEPLENLAESHAAEPLPPDYVMNREEEAILWRSLQTIPETYREPLVLYYREHQSVERVAQALGLSEEAVHQRLSRGRKLLQEQVLAFVEGALKRTAPGKTFTLGVLTALSLVAPSAKAATVGTAVAKASVTTKTGTALGTVGGLLPALGSYYLIFKSDLEFAKSPREREFMVCSFWFQTVVLLMLMTLMGGLLFERSFVHNRGLLWAVFCFGLLACVFMLGNYAKRRRRQIQIEDGTFVEPMAREQRKEYLDRLRRNGSKGKVYLYLAMAANMGGLAFVEFKHLWNGERGHLLFFELLLGLSLFSFIQAWRCRLR